MNKQLIIDSRHLCNGETIRTVVWGLLHGFDLRYMYIHRW